MSKPDYHTEKSPWDELQWQRIEEEYQEPARDVVQVFHHDMKIPLCRIAKILYISESTLRKWCKIWNLSTRRQGYVKKETFGRVQFLVRQMGYKDVSQAIADMRASGKRWEDIQLILKCSSSTISRYMSENTKGYQNISAEGLEKKRRAAKKLNERMANGEIRRGGFAKVPLEMVVPRFERET